MTRHVLVVDDDADVRDTITAVLKDDGFSVAFAQNGAEALKRIAENRPRLVILDLQRPGMSGWDVLTQLRDAQVDVPVVFMSAGYRAKTEAERHQAAGYLTKPFDIQDVIDVAERFTDRTTSDRS
jgi:CheY-like chemotaxis protein